MPIRVVITPPTDIIEAINEQMALTPRLMATAYKRNTARLKARLLEELRREPGKPNYPLRWKSDRQRRYVMAKLRSEGNLPYQRTHDLSRGWVATVEASGEGGIFTVENEVPYARYVIGDDAQPFHLDTGWGQAAPIITRYIDELDDVLIETWATVSDPYAGVKG